MSNIFIKILLLITLFPINMLHAEQVALSKNMMIEPYLFEINTDFSKIEEKIVLERIMPSVNFIKESNWYRIKSPIGLISLQEWQGKLHCIAYEIDLHDVTLKSQIIDDLFTAYENNFKWVDKRDNGLYISYESSNDSIQGIHAYSLGTTISFTSNEIRKAETKIRFPNL